MIAEPTGNDSSMNLQLDYKKVSSQIDKNVEMEDVNVEINRRKKLFHNIVQKWEVEVSISVVVSVHYSLKRGNEY